MAMDKIEVRSTQGDLLVLTLEDISNGYIVEGVDGLDPVKAAIASSKFANLDGQQYHSSSLDVRNIRITLGYFPDETLGQTVRTLRTNLYKFFMPKREVQLRFFMQDGLVVNISGYVESCEAPLFSSEPQTVISVLCMDPDFVDNAEVELTNFMTNDTLDTEIDIQGSVSTGLLLELRAYAAFNEFTLYHTSPAGVITTMQFAIPLLINDLISMETTPGFKSLTLKRANVVTPALYAVSPQSPWIQLEPGVNKLRVYATPTTGSPAYISYRNRYGGL
jgi:hypothetical protein